MLALFLALAFSVRENERRICVCNDACPKVCDVFEKILIYYTPDLDAEFTKLKTKYMDIRFCHAPSPFTFNIGTFDGCEVQFDSFHLAPKAHVKVMVTRASTAEPSFNNLVVTFAGHSPSQVFDIKAIQFNEVDSHNENIAPRLITQSFEASNSVYDFTDVTIKKDCSDPALAIDVLRGYNLELTIGKNIVTYGSSTFHFEGKSTATISTQLKDVKLTVNGVAEEDMPYLILVGFPYTTFKGKYPPDYIIQMQNLEENTVVAAEKRLPISLDGARVNVYVSQPETVIEGDSSCDVNLYTKAQPAQRYKVTIVKLNGKIDVFSSWLDVHLNVFNPALQIWEAPWSFCVGRGGVSTLYIANTLYTGTSPVSAFKYHCDFNIYLDDDQLKNLLQKTHNILVVDTNKTVFTADSVSIIPVDNLDIPGFASSSNCISIEIAKQYPFQISLKAVSPTTLPLKLCYADEISQCQVDSDGFFINSYLISNLSTCIHPGFNKVTITLKKDLTSIDFGSLIKTQTNLDVEIISKLSQNPTLGSIIGAKKEIVKSIKFTNVDIGGGQIECDTVSFTGCGRVDSINRTLSFVTTTLVEADDHSLNIYNKDVSDLKNLYLKLSHYDSISSQNNKIILSDSSSDYEPINLDTSDLSTFSILAVDTLYLNPKGFTKDFKINHIFTDKMSSNRLVLTDTLPQSAHITYNHSTYDVEIVRGNNKNFGNLVLEGSGEVSYINDYEESTRFCVADSKSKCTGYSYDDDHIITPNDQGAKIKNAKEKKIYVDTYSEYSLPLSAIVQKVVEFQNFAGRSINLKINVDTTDDSPETTTTKITGFSVGFENVNTDTKFGHLEMRNCTVLPPGFNGKAIKAVDFIGPFNVLSGVTSLDVDGYCEFYGVASSSKLDISKNTNVRRFRACIPNDSTVTVTDDKIQIDNFELTVGHNDEGLFDVDLYTDKATTFTLVHGGGTMSKFPKIKFSKLISTTVNFNGAWPAETNPVNFKLIFAHTQYQFNLNINTENVPAQFDNVQMNFNVVSSQNSVKVYGLFNVVSEEYHEMTISGPEKGAINFIGGIGVDYKSWIKILNPITVTISEVSLTDTSRTEGTISFQHYVRAGANSKVIIQSKLKNLNFNPVFEIYGDFHQSLDSDEIKKFLDTTVDLCSINTEDVSKFKNEVKSVQFVDPLPTTHGFVGSNFEVYIPEDFTEALIYLRKKSDPLKTPAKACFATPLTTDCDFSLGDENISTFASLLPNSIETIEFTFGQGNSVPLNLNNGKFNNVRLSVISSTGKPVKVKLISGSGHIGHLYAQNIDFELSVQSNGNEINSAKFENSISNTYAAFGELECDFESWKRKAIDSFPGKFLMNYPETDFTFKANGWALQDHDNIYEISAANFPNFAIKFTTPSYVYLKADRDTASVASCTAYIQTTNIEVGSNWNKITSPPVLNIITEKPLNEIVVTCRSYPFSVLPLTNGTTIKFGKETLPIVTEEPILLNNTQFTIDFSLVENKNESRLQVDNAIELEGNSTIYFPNSKNTSFPCIAKEVIAKDGSDSSATDIYATGRVAVYGNAKLSTAINFSQATFEFHYWKDHMPYFNNLIEIAPKGVTVFYDGKVSQAGFIKGESFTFADIGPSCESWLTNVKYSSKEKQFKGKKSRAKLSCVDGALTIKGDKNIRSLSVGAICGIVFGCIAFVAIVVFLVIFFLKRRQNNAAANSNLLTSSLTSQ